MSIPESQLETWSHQGSITQSATTYNTVKNALEISSSPYAKKDFKIFLQGSYGNDTNVFAESDVDVVIQLDDVFQHDLTALTEDQRTNFSSAMPNATYTYSDFKNDVLGVLNAKFGADVKSGEKAINIAANGTRRKADVIVAIQFRRYYKFNGIYDQRYDEGICFYSTSGERIVNYPKHHSKNLTTKHQNTGGMFKPTVRVLKNLRGKLVDDKLIESGTAPSYYLEGLLYNVPAEKFMTKYESTMVNCINWLSESERENFVCANEQYYLLRENSPVTWRAAKCKEFLTASIKLWNEW